MKRKSSTPNKSNALLPLLQRLRGHTLLLVHFRGVTGRLEGVAGGGQRLEIGTVVLVGLH